MKAKIFCIFLLLMVSIFSVIGCTSTESKIELTPINYNDYLKIVTYTSSDGVKQIEDLELYYKTGVSYFTISSKVPGKYKNVRINLKVHTHRDVELCESIVLPTNGEYTSFAYRVGGVVCDLADDPNFSVDVESISGTFKPD